MLGKRLPEYDDDGCSLVYVRNGKNWDPIGTAKTREAAYDWALALFDEGFDVLVNGQESRHDVHFLVE